MPAANAFSLIRANVQSILSWAELSALVAVEDQKVHDHDVDLRAADGEPGLTGRKIELIPARRSFGFYSSDKWSFDLRFLAMINIQGLPVAELEKVEWLMLRAATFLKFERIPGTATALPAVTPAIVDHYTVDDIDPQKDFEFASLPGWEAVCAIVVTGSIAFADLLAA